MYALVLASVGDDAPGNMIAPKGMEHELERRRLTMVDRPMRGCDRRWAQWTERCQDRRCQSSHGLLWARAVVA